MRTALLTCLALLTLAGHAAPIVVTDDLGREVRIPAPATRIVSLAPHLTEILFDLGVGERVTGTVRYSDYPPAASKITRVGDAFSVSVESVIAMRPDIVFAWATGGASRSVDQLIELGVPVYINEAPALADIPRTVERIAALVGRSEEGLVLASGFRATLDELRRSATQTFQHARHPVVFFQISDDNLYTVNDTHLIGEAISLCGGRNLFGDLAVPVPVVGVEAVIAGRPDVIFMTHVPGTALPAWHDRWQKTRGVSARLATINPDLISRPGLRMRAGVARLCEVIGDSTANP